MAYARKASGGIRELPIAPMIDMVFLLLAYFMVSATIQKQEAQLAFSLPGTVRQTERIEMPDEQIVTLDSTGQALVNEYAYDSPNDRSYLRLAAMLTRFKEASVSNRSDARITIAPDPKTNHAAIVKVMDACAIAKIDSVTFAMQD